jgi:tetratricopeptide (TPR) repeat protein
VCAAPRSGASSGVFHPDLVDASSKLDRAKGPETYTALRRIWQTWDRAEPAQVEEVLRAAEQNTRLTPAERVYAGMLVAYARSRRGDLAAARTHLKRLGFVDRWLVVGPFDNEGKVGLDTEYEPELEFGKTIVPGRAFSGKERPVRWRAAPLAFPYGFLDMGALIRPEQKSCAYATTFVQKPTGSRAISAWVGVSGSFKLFFNGAEVLADKAYRSHDADRRAVSLTLATGWNNFTLKLCGDESAPTASLRLASATGAPEPGIEVTAELAASEQAAAQAKPAPGEGQRGTTPPKPARRAGVEGPLDALERLTLAKNAPAELLEAFAQYLVVTQGDDPATHRARDLAHTVAEKAPTVERLLLAAELAEDRNRASVWLDRAHALMTRQRDVDTRVLLARAAHARRGPNWRDALPYYDQVLRLDADNVAAIQGRAELYNEAGLGRTALALIERAVEKNPGSIYLLNMLASQLRAQGRSTEADEVESRYSALRFDDRTYLNQRVELSLQSGDARATERWVERLLAIDPDSQWALSVAARAYRALGQPDRAIATYQRALELSPEDVGTLRTLANLHGELGQRDQQLRLLRQVLAIRPQDKEVREYVAQIEPDRARADEAYAWAPARFLKLRSAPASGQNTRTLRDLHVSTVYPSGLSSKFRQVVFQPLTDAAAAAGRHFAFQYEADRQTVQLRGARVFRADGRVDEAIEAGEAAADDPSISMYTSARNFYVQLPRLEPGDVVELRYRIDETVPRNEFADYFGEVVYLQSGEPVANAEYVLVTPKARTFYIDTNLRNLKREVKESDTQRTYRFFADAVRPLPPEPAMPPWPEVLGFVHVSTYKTWKDVGRWYWGLSREQFDLDEQTRSLAREITKNAKTELDKVKAVYGWVVNNTRYVALEFGIYGYKPRRCVQTVARGWGDCKDKATVIVTLLKELGIPSTIVVLRTQHRGDFRSRVASLAPFDHAIAYVPSLNLYLDGTAEHTGTMELPRADLGALGLLVNEGDTELVHLPSADPEKNVLERHIIAQLAPSGEAKLELTLDVRGSSAVEWRRRYQAEGTRRDRVVADLAREFPGLVLLPANQGLSASDLTDIEQPVQLTARGTAPALARREGNELTLSVTPDARLTPQYASMSQRRHDVVLLGVPTIDETFTVKLPPGTRVRSAPLPASGDTRFGYYRVEVEQKPGSVTVHTRVALKVNRVSPAEYPQWQKFCNSADAALSARLVVGP